MRDSVRDRCELCTLMLYVYSAQPWLFHFSRCRLSVHYSHSCRAAQGPARPSQQGCIAALGAYGSLAWCTWLDTFQYPQPALITASGALIPECNDLSQFREDTGEPSIPVREFNLIACLLVQSLRKTPFQSRIRTPVGESPQPIRLAGTVAYLTVV